MTEKLLIQVSVKARISLGKHLIDFHLVQLMVHCFENQKQAWFWEQQGSLKSHHQQLSALESESDEERFLLKC